MKALFIAPSPTNTLKVFTIWNAPQYASTIPKKKFTVMFLNSPRILDKNVPDAFTNIPLIENIKNKNLNLIPNFFQTIKGRCSKNQKNSFWKGHCSSSHARILFFLDFAIFNFTRK